MADCLLDAATRPSPRRVPSGAIRSADRIVAALLSAVLRLYRVTLSPLLGPACRFEPSCSRFAEEAVSSHGAWRGGAMALGRLLRCHPWGGPGGYDPVPHERTARALQEH